MCCLYAKLSAIFVPNIKKHTMNALVNTYFYFYYYFGKYIGIV